MHSMSLPLAVFNETHLILLLIILLLLFGGKKLPELARGLGEAMREFKKASRDIADEHHGHTGQARGANVNGLHNGEQPAAKIVLTPPPMVDALA